MTKTRCAYCLYESDYRHVAICPLSPRWREILTATLNDGTGRIHYKCHYDTIRPLGAPSARALTQIFGTWHKVAEEYYLLPTINKQHPRPGRNGMDDPLTEAETNVCQKRNHLERQWRN